MSEREHAGGVQARRIAVVAGIAIGVLALVVVGASAVEHVVYSGHVLPGVDVDGVHLAGRGDRAAIDAVNRLGTELARTPLRVRAGDNHYTVTPAFVGFTVDAAATVRKANEEGRSGNPFALVGSTVMRRLRPDHVPLVVHYDSARLEGLLDGWGNAVDVGLVEGGLKIDGTRVTTIEPHSGTGMQRDAARRELVHALESTDHSSEITLPIGAIDPQVDAAEVARAAARAQAVLTGNHEIDIESTRIIVTPQQLAPALGTRVSGNDLQLVVNAQLLRFVLGQALAIVEQPAADATFAVSSTNAVTVVPSRNGRGVDLNAIGDAILAGRRLIAAPVRTIHPAHDTAWATKLGITKFVSSFTTYHQAGQPRVHNIHLAADILNNTVVEPGKTFSLNNLLGPRTPEKGYVKAPILVEDGFGEDYGGGVSQLTTTLYNAVFFGGYEDVEHTPHQYYISRYPMGREATINYPSIDLKFRDDTKFGVLIRTSYSDTSITVSFYGNNEGRTVREENRKILRTEPVTDQLVACPANPQDDPGNDCAHLAAFERHTAQPGEPGYDVEFERVIDQPGRPERRHKYSVHYPMLPNKVLVGAGSAASTTPSTPSSLPASSAVPATPPASLPPAPTTRPAGSTPTTQRHL